jgi:hypothetical protein
VIEPRPGGRVQLCWSDGCAEGEFLQIESPIAGRFSFNMQDAAVPETIVCIGLEPTEHDGQPATLVELEHYGFGVGPDWDMLYVSCARAWAGYIKNLRSVLEAGLDLREPDE